MAFYDFSFKEIHNPRANPLLLKLGQYEYALNVVPVQRACPDQILLKGDGIYFSCCNIVCNVFFAVKRQKELDRRFRIILCIYRFDRHMNQFVYIRSHIHGGLHDGRLQVLSHVHFSCKWGFYPSLPHGGHSSKGSFAYT